MNRSYRKQVRINNSKSKPTLRSYHARPYCDDGDRPGRDTAFYEEHLAFHTNEEVVYDGLRRIFMSASENHHDLVLLESRIGEFPPIEQWQLQQVAFQVHYTRYPR